MDEESVKLMDMYSQRLQVSENIAKDICRNLPSKPAGLYADSLNMSQLYPGNNNQIKEFIALMLHKTDAIINTKVHRDGMRKEEGTFKRAILDYITCMGSMLLAYDQGLDTQELAAFIVEVNGNLCETLNYEPTVILE